MLKRIISNFFVFLFLFLFVFSVNAGVKTGMTIFAVKKIVPHLVKGYGKKVGGYAETKVINYIKKNRIQKKKYFQLLMIMLKKIRHI